MRIALVTTSWPANDADPAGHFVRSSARALERQGHEVEVVAPPTGGAFGWPGVAARLRERPLRAVGAARWVSHARARVARIAAHRVIAHWAVPCAWPIASGSPSLPLEVVSHGGDVRLLMAMPVLARRFVVRAIASQSSAWTFVSDTLLHALLGSLDRTDRANVERIAVVRAPILELPDVRDAVQSLRAELGATRVAVSVGRLIASKRVDRAIDHVGRTREVNALVVVGDGPERSKLERRALARGVDARFVGAVGRVEALAWIGAADALIQASSAEGLSTVVREAEALGTPVIHLGDPSDAEEGGFT
jgi:teichuronic acid biosynthesis glycosyltransferase TuaC